MYKKRILHRSHELIRDSFQVKNQWINLVFFVFMAAQILTVKEKKNPLQNLSKEKALEITDTYYIQNMQKIKVLQKKKRTSYKKK